MKKYILIYKPKHAFNKEYALFQSSNKKAIKDFKKGFKKLYFDCYFKEITIKI